MTVSDTSNRTILVTGITGSQGNAVARHLLKKGWQVRGLTRSPDNDKARELALSGVEIVKGDMASRPALEKALEGMYGLFLVLDWVSHGAEGEVRLGRLVSDVAREKGIKHLVLSSIHRCKENEGVSHIDSKIEMEGYIRELGIPATNLRLTVFMDNLFEKKYFPMAVWDMMFKFVGPDKQLQWIATEDIGAIAAAVFEDPAKFIGQTLTVAGDKKSISEAREIFKKVMGKAPFRLHLPAWVWPHIPKGEELVSMFQALRKTSFDWDIEAARAIHPGLLDMESWLRQRLEKERKS